MGMIMVTNHWDIGINSITSSLGLVIAFPHPSVYLTLDSILI